MKTKKRIFLLAFSALIFANVHTVNAQVTIGSELEPNVGALLDLKENSDGSSTKGFNLPRVYLTSVNSLEPCVTSASDADKANHKGLQVYNTNTSLGEGIYTWNGSSWAQGGLKPIFKSITNIVNEEGGRGHKLAEFEIETAGLYSVSFNVSFNKTKSVIDDDATGIMVLSPSGSYLLYDFSRYSKSWGVNSAHQVFLLTPGKYIVQTHFNEIDGKYDIWTIEMWNFTVIQWS